MVYIIGIAVEKYRDRNISRVEYAENDAREMSIVLQDTAKLDNELHLLINSGATKTLIESKIRQISRELNKDDKLYFYYAGHGFANSDKNYITCYDTVTGDLEDTSIPIQFVFSTLKDKCDSIIYFFDSCHSGLNINQSMRGIYSDLNKNEFIEELKNRKYNIGFAACKSDEVSWPIQTLRHGAWTYHLIQAFNGSADEALEKGTLLTLYSLQNYLSHSIPITLKRAYKPAKVQSPWFFGGGESDAVIVDLQEQVKKHKAPQPNIKDIEFILKEVGSIKSLSGFKKGFRVPEWKNLTTERFVHDIAKEDLENEVNRIHEILKSNLGYKRKDISISTSDGSISLLTKDFVIHISINQAETDFGEYEKTIDLTEISNKNLVKSAEFNEAFADMFDAMIITLDKRIDIVRLIDDIEELRNTEIELDYPPDCSYCDLRLEGRPASIRINGIEINIQLPKSDSPIALLNSIYEINEKLVVDKCNTKLIE